VPLYRGLNGGDVVTLEGQQVLGHGPMRAGPAAHLRK